MSDILMYIFICIVLISCVDVVIVVLWVVMLVSLLFLLLVLVLLIGVIVLMGIFVWCVNRFWLVIDLKCGGCICVIYNVMVGVILIRISSFISM